MKIATFALAGIAVLVAVAGARYQGVKRMSLITKPLILRHTFPKLTPSQILAAYKLFGVIPPPTFSTAKFTLTPNVPYYAPLQTSLSANGNWYTAPGANCVVNNTGGWAEVYLQHIDPTKSYLVMFNVSVQGQPVSVTMFSATQTSDGDTTGPLAPTATVNSPVSLPVVVSGGANAAEIDFNLPANTSLTLESVDISPQ
jgi:hypothetical protein